MSAVIGTIVAIIVIFVDRGGWSSSVGTHGITGILTFLFSMSNPIIAFFRPDKTSEKRYLFSIFHGGIGYLCFVLALSTIFLGFDLRMFDLDFWITQLFAALVGFVALISIFAELFKRRLDGSKHLILFGIFVIICSIISLVIII